MINILPDHGRARARLMYRLRLAAVALCAAGGAFLVAAALLSPAYFNATVLERAARAEAALVDRLNDESSEAEAPLVAAAGYLEAYAPMLTQQTAGERIERVLRARPPGVTFSQIAYVRASGEVRVSGVAATRESLLSLERALKATTGISSVALPVSALARSTNAPFSVTVAFSEEAS